MYGAIISFFRNFRQTHLPLHNSELRLHLFVPSDVDVWQGAFDFGAEDRRRADWRAVSRCECFCRRRDRWERCDGRRRTPRGREIADGDPAFGRPRNFFKINQGHPARSRLSVLVVVQGWSVSDGGDLGWGRTGARPRHRVEIRERVFGTLIENRSPFDN